MTQFQPFPNNSMKAVEYLMHHFSCHHWSSITGDILRSSGQTTTQKQFKIIGSAGRKAFGDLIRYYKSDITKNCQVCIPP